MQNLQFIQTTPQELVKLISESVNLQIQELKKNLQSQSANDDLLTREQACELLSINSSTLYHWTNKGKVKAYGIGNRRYYKRSELLDSLIQLKK